MVIFNNFDYGIYTPTGDRLSEYTFPGPESSPNTKTVYVQVPEVESQPFTIRIIRTTPLPSTTYGHSFFLTLDGFKSAACYPICHEYPETLTQGYNLTGFDFPAETDNTMAVTKGPMFFEPLQFSLGEDGSDDEDGDDEGVIGTIEVVGSELVEIEPDSGEKLENEGRRRPGESVRKGKVKGRAVSHTTRIGETVIKEAAKLGGSKAALQRLGIEVKADPPRRDIIEGTAWVLKQRTSWGVRKWIKRMFGGKEKRDREFRRKERKI
ncbi:hypothetical protein BJ508DRAFT_305713 [Ascobolus immersus RN42]|uniref:DUF7918 domain-containing protein n=1 Tax=Ascobolus immersus RN42 TaxID=1160509 RepID=A0A3N4IL25_ASCIM|nr:hypothetical protein BJ508DRAFT_305713 [Ascobolus immersus RN42]